MQLRTRKKEFKILSEKKIKLKALSVDPRQDGAIKLKGYNAYRVKCGRYRIIYEIKYDKLIVLVLDVDARKDIYKGL
ncbi:type II toxin-antitoxin system RelE family toxin [Candidatus Protochlamydia amoebophila]|uniref:Uncharacterized protein n=1 Tax=Protochlamydia amoebophila (strain UWE25) TaxID=264201 RepID=A0A2P9HAK3_PARUW|nr:unnamed protein product [Candidatus Protochlamydia amoebophila UWE25]